MDLQNGEILHHFVYPIWVDDDLQHPRLGRGEIRQRLGGKSGEVCRGRGHFQSTAPR